MQINLISDTVTKPTKGMLKAMWAAEVGDDVFREDPSINRLEIYAAERFGKEAALFCPSGTMTNQIALKVHTRPLDEVICHQKSHIYTSEVAGYAWNSGIGVNLVDGKNGILKAENVEAAIKPKADWLPISRLISLENTSNFGGGTCYSLEEMKAIQKVAKKHKLALHLDGARLYNAIVAKKYSTEALGKIFDTISICLSKGLGAPVGSLLLGEKGFIAEARRVRKAMGGGMRQAGYLAAAGQFALEHQVERLDEDHANAQILAKKICQLDWMESMLPVETNILIFDVKTGRSSMDFVTYAKERGLNCAAFGPKTVRFVTHLDVSKKMIQQACEVLEGF